MKILFGLTGSRMFIPRDSDLFKQNFTIFTNLLLDLISLAFYVLFCFERKEI